jgi:choline dehydrogenase
MSYEYLIVGGGAAGCVVANRLTEDPSTRVLVVEAGRPDYKWDLYVHMPAALVFAIGNRFYDWQYESEPEEHMAGRRIYHARGKLLGGSTSINGMIWQRGNPLDYERWASDPGMESWDFAHCLPYFKRIESRFAGGEWRGVSGPMQLEPGPVKNPLFSAFFDAVRQAGYHLTEDTNGFRQEGFSPMDRTIVNGRRLNASQAYLTPIRDRANLEVRTRTFVNRILFDGTRAIGVEVVRKGRVEKIYANEVILAGGVFNTPQLLQLAGVGNKRELEALGVRVIHELPGVGEHMQDHLEVYVQHTAKEPVSVAPALRRRNRLGVGLRWLMLREGPASTNQFEAGGFIRTDETEPYPNVMFHFLPIAVSYDGTIPPGHSYQVNVGPTLSDAEGTVKVVSTDPRRHPELRFNYLSTEKDRREWVGAIRAARSILGQQAFARYDGGEIAPGPDVQTDEEILRWVERRAETMPHPCCTCRMGTGEGDVVDPQTMRVRGLDGIRVVDASAMPYVTNGNIWAPGTMLAEKASDLIRGESLDPIEVPYYRAEVGS